MDKAVDGVILAAGTSRRMERPKPLLAVGDETFAERAARTLAQAGCRRTYLVVGPDAGWAEELAQAEGVVVVVNPQAGSEQIDSLRLVVGRLPEDCDAILVLPVDLPLVTPATAAAVVDAYRREPGPLFLPFHNTVAGHPVLLDRALFDELSDPALEEGVRSLIMRHARDLKEVKVMDPGILIDIDTPDDYWRYIEDK
ncbi:MAG TPA: nucleotidyltransferase family protein [Longimicrobiales bacterium]|nr:nucleotidyltransferase family protein [Longimicrobiales bacterium]